MDWFVKWQAPNHLPLPANEDDNFAFTQGIQGSVAVLAGLKVQQKKKKKKTVFTLHNSLGLISFGVIAMQVYHK